MYCSTKCIYVFVYVDVECTSIWRVLAFSLSLGLHALMLVGKDVQAMTVYDSPDYLEAWWMRRDSSKCWVEFAALEKFRHPQVSSHAIASVKFLSLFATRLDTDNALCPHVVTRKIRPTKPEREKKISSHEAPAGGTSLATMVVSYGTG
jgi:hypothetical protein